MNLKGHQQKRTTDDRRRTMGQASSIVAAMPQWSIVIFAITTLLIISISFFFLTTQNEENGGNSAEQLACPTHAAPPQARMAAQPISDKWSLWSSGQTLLRGVNIWQAVVVPELDGDTFKGRDSVGPPFTQADFDCLAALGANYVTLSHPGTFSVKPPFEPDEAVVAHLDTLLVHWGVSFRPVLSG